MLDDIELVAIDRLATVEFGPVEETIAAESSVINTANLETLLIENANWSPAATGSERLATAIVDGPLRL